MIGIAILFATSFQSLWAIDVEVEILPAPPENAAVVHTSSTQVQLSWDASPSPPTDITSYDVFYKLTTTANYPGTPQITRTDTLASYSENITVSAGLTYDFIIFANAASGQTSSANCASCHVVNTPPPAGGGGGGGGGPPEDNTPPNPGVATSPPYAGTSPIAITYSGASDSGGSGLNYVQLMYKKGTGSWKNSNQTSSGSSGSFEFTPDASPNANYYFDLQAFDNRGNLSAAPTASGDTTTVYDTQLPTIESIIILDSLEGGPITVEYENAADVGISGFDRVELWYKQGEEGEWTNSELSSIEVSDIFEFAPEGGAAEYFFDVIAFDKAGNQSEETDESTASYLYDVQPPTVGAIDVITDSSEAPIVIEYEDAIDTGPAGLKQVELWYKKEMNGTWTKTGQASQAADGSLAFIPTEGDGTYYFDLVLEDNLGNKSDEPDGDGLANVVYTAEPFAAILISVPLEVSELDNADIEVGGDNIVAYRYKLNAEEYSEEVPIDMHIVLSELTEGDYFLSVIGKNNFGQWQDLENPTEYNWTVQFPEEPAPEVAEEGEEDEPPVVEETPEEEEETEEVSEVPEPTPTTGGKDEPEPVEEPEDTKPAAPEQEDVEDEVQEIEPEITAPEPKVEYTSDQIIEKAQNVTIKRTPSPETPILTVPDTEEKVLTRIEQCKLEFPTLSFVSQSLDSDGDGLSDKTECYALTSPISDDTDQDGCLDGDEVNQYATNPLDPEDCQLDERLKIVSISSPQSGWLLSDLEVVTGLTPETTSQVHLIAFPVENGVSLEEDPIRLGTVNQFNPSSIEGHYHFEIKPETTLEDGNEYELVAVGVLVEGDIIDSKAVRISLDSQKKTVQPKPLAIGDILLTGDIDLSNLEVEATKDGKVKIRGESEYGAQVFATWESVVLASSVIADSTLGEFTIESPRALEGEADHEVTLFAIQEEEGKKIKSKNVTVSFYLKEPAEFPYKAVIVAILILTLSTLSASMLNRWRTKKS